MTAAAQNLSAWLKKQDLFRLCLTGSLVLHLTVVSGYYISQYIKFETYEQEEIFRDVEVDFEEIPPELIGGDKNPAPVEKQEWVEGSNKNGKDPEPTEETDPNLVSGTGTDKDGYMFSYFGDKPPTPIVDFDLKRFFPEAAKSANISEKVVVMVVQVDEKGKLISAKIVSGEAGYGFDEAAMRIVNLIRFSPGYIKGRPVRMSHRMPIHFTLED